MKLTRKVIAITIILAAAVAGSFWIIKNNPQDISQTVAEKISGEVQKIEDRKPVNTPTKVLLDVPFTSQAPTGNWSDDRYQDGCEEASMLMAVEWATNSTISQQEALDKIADMSAFEQSMLGTYHDTSAVDTVKWSKEYFDYEKIENFTDVTVQDIKNQLSEGKVVVVPANWTKLNNPNFTPPGPIRHMLVIRGFDEEKKQFITNDPGTRKGEGYRYPYEVLFNAILDYPTGHHEEVISDKKVMIVISKQ